MLDDANERVLVDAYRRLSAAQQSALLVLLKGCAGAPPNAAAPQPDDLLSPGDLMRLVGLRKSRFHLLQKRGVFKHLEVSRPFGTRRYSRVLVERFLAGESTSQFGRRRV